MSGDGAVAAGGLGDGVPDSIAEYFQEESSVAPVELSPPASVASRRRSQSGSSLLLPMTIPGLVAHPSGTGMLARRLTSSEILSILSTPSAFGLDVLTETATRPPSGFLYVVRKVARRNFRKDGHFWKSRSYSTSLREDHVRLHLSGEAKLYACYAHSSEWPSFHRRLYWVIGSPQLVLIHYLDDLQVERPVPDVVLRDEESIDDEALASFPELSDDVSSSLDELGASAARPPVLALADYAPAWSFVEGQQRVLLVGGFQPGVGYRCAFGDALVSAEHVAPNVISCVSPAHPAGTVALRVFGSDDSASEGRAFEYRANPAGDWSALPEAVVQGRLVELLGVIEGNLTAINSELRGASGGAGDDAFQRLVSDIQSKDAAGHSSPFLVSLESRLMLLVCKLSAIMGSDNLCAFMWEHADPHGFTLAHYAAALGLVGLVNLMFVITSNKFLISVPEHKAHIQLSAAPAAAPPPPSPLWIAAALGRVGVVEAYVSFVLHLLPAEWLGMLEGIAAARGKTQVAAALQRAIRSKTSSGSDRVADVLYIRDAIINVLHLREQQRAGRPVDAFGLEAQKMQGALRNYRQQVVNNKRQQMDMAVDEEEEEEEEEESVPADVVMGERRQVHQQGGKATGARHDDELRLQSKAVTIQRAFRKYNRRRQRAAQIIQSTFRHHMHRHRSFAN